MGDEPMTPEPRGKATRKGFLRRHLWAIVVAAVTAVVAAVSTASPSGPAPALSAPLIFPSPTAALLTPTGTPTRASGAIASLNEIQRITAVDAKALVDAGLALLYDVRGAEYYQAKHATGAISLPETALASINGELPEGKALIFY